MAKHRVHVANYNKFILFIFILIAITVLLLGIILYDKSESSLVEQFLPVEITDDMQYMILDDYYVTLNGKLLNLYDYDNILVWSKEVSSPKLILNASNRLVVIHNEKNIQVLNIEGEHLYSTDVIGRIKSVKCGLTTVAVFSEINATVGKPENMVYFYNTSGNLFDSISFAPQHIIDYGFVDSGDIWVLTTDPSNAVPVSRIITYKPGVSMTGLTNLYSEIAYKAFFTDKNIFVATTNNLIKFNLFGEEQNSNTIYDWDIKTQDIFAEEPCFVAVPRSQNFESYFVNGKIIYENSYNKVNFPSKVDSMLMNNNQLYLFGDDIIYVYSAKGKYLRQYKTEGNVQFLEFIKDNVVLVKFDGGYNILTLP